MTIEERSHQQLYDEDVDPVTPEVGASTSQGLGNLLASDELPSAWQESPS